MNVIPAIDIKDGRCVRLFQGEFDRQTQYSANPKAIAEQFESMGFSHLHLVDLDGARSGEQKNRQLVTEITAATGFVVQLGGGIRDSETLRSWLETGVERCVIGSVAVVEPRLVKSWIEKFGAGHIVLALDVRIDDADVPYLATHGWSTTSETTLWQCLDEFVPTGLKHILCTDISRDGAMQGPNLELYRQVIRRYPAIALQASGGVRSIGDLEQLRRIGSAAAITGRALLDGKISKEELMSFQRGE